MTKYKKAFSIISIFITLTFGVWNVAYSSSNIHHTVVAGDTYWKLSNMYKVPLDQLLAVNNAKENSTLFIGQQVIIPISAPAVPQSTIKYTVVKGDTYWLISQRFNVPLQKILEANNASNNPTLFVGQVINIPTQQLIHIAKAGDTYWKISQYYNVDFNRLLEINKAWNGNLMIGQPVIIPTNPPSPALPQQSTGQNSKTIITHTVKPGDDPWKLSIQYGVPMHEILSLNGLTPNSVLFIGQILRIPVYHIAIKPTPGPQYGELLDWWTEAQYVWPIGKNAVMIDFYTGRQWNVRRTMGANHADVEPLTQNDTNIMRQVWGGQWSWATRPVIIVIDGRRLAASANGMPHSTQQITNNGFNGHFCVHFLNSTTHSNNEGVATHQRNVKIAAGM